MKKINSLGMEETTHPTFGMLRFSRISSNIPQPLFGSSIKHCNMISIEICEGEVQRGLSQNWYHAGKVLVRAEMSSTQFADAITSLNGGEGIPITLSRVNGEERGECPYESVVEQFNKEFDKDTEMIAKKCDSALQKAEAMLEGKRGKQEIVNLINEIKMLKQQMGLNTKFINDQFSRQMAHTVKEAKGEVDAFINNLIHRTGIKALNEQKPVLPVIGVDNAT